MPSTPSDFARVRREPADEYTGDDGDHDADVEPVRTVTRLLLALDGLRRPRRPCCTRAHAVSLLSDDARRVDSVDLRVIGVHADSLVNAGNPTRPRRSLCSLGSREDSRAPRHLPPTDDVARQLLLLQLVVLALVIAAGSAFAIIDERRDSDDAPPRGDTRRRDPRTVRRDDRRAARPRPDLSAPARGRTHPDATGTDFIVVMAPDRTRFTHPDPTLIGQRFEGHIEQALAGETFTETYTGSLGPSIRAVARWSRTGKWWVWCRWVSRVSASVSSSHRGCPRCWGSPRSRCDRGRRRRSGEPSPAPADPRTRPDQLRRLYEHHDAVLRSIGEGLIVFGRDRDGRVRVDVVNDEARRLLWLPDGPITPDQLPETLRASAPTPTANRTRCT